MATQGITIKTKEEIEILREGGKRLAEILRNVADAAKPGVSTLDLDRIAERLVLDSGGTPSFKGYRIAETKIPFPGSICASINDEIVHGIPRADRVLKNGDVVGLDIGMQWPSEASAKEASGPMGLYTDMAVTVGIGKISKQAEDLLQATKEALDIGIQAVRAGITVGDIGNAIEKHLKKSRYGIVRDLAGHGVGHALHEEPLIPNYGKAGTGIELREGMVIAIEPMATLGDWRISLDDDEWTFRAADGSLAAHFEHTMAVTKDGADVLTKL